MRGSPDPARGVTVRSHESGRLAVSGFAEVGRPAPSAPRNCERPFRLDKEKGCGFLEAVYQECLEIERRLQNVDFSSQPRLVLQYKGQRLKNEYVPDLICFSKIVVELKAVSALSDEHRAQVHNYLKATGHRLGLLANSGHHSQVEIERIIR